MSKKDIGKYTLLDENNEKLDVNVEDYLVDDQDIDNTL